MTDEELNRAVEELARGFWVQLRRYAERLGALDAEAAVADAFEALGPALVRLPSINSAPVLSIDSAPGWLYSTVRNKVCTQYRRRQSERNAVERIERDPTATTTTPSAEQEMLRREITKEVNEAIRRLPPRQRDIAELRLLYHYTYKEVAEALGIADGNVKSQLNRACKKLRKIVERPE
jgi:RNA polymerase sigma factor (sigma-70 family)